MKSIMQKYPAPRLQSVLIVFFAFSCFLFVPNAVAQIPQNIEVDGEPSDIMSYVYYGLALIVFIVLILILGKFFRRKE